MCGIVGILSLKGEAIPDMERRLGVMSALVAHRGPDGQGIWIDPSHRAGLAHRRLAIIDLSERGAQPMSGHDGSVITFDGQIYNHLELQQALHSGWDFRSESGAETILAAHERWGANTPDRLRGMFSYIRWQDGEFFAARDPFGIKPLYYAELGGVLYLASEIKSLLPFLPEIETSPEALAEYLTFQYQVGPENLFRHVHTLLPGHLLRTARGRVIVERYWDIHYEIDFDHTPRYFEERLADALSQSMAHHMRADVPVGTYLSGGLDSSLVGALSARHPNTAGVGFHGKFLDAPAYDESRFARAAAEGAGIELNEIAIGADDFRDAIFKVLYHLDQPVAGPGAFAQYVVSRAAAKQVKVVLGGQGGDEIFGGYARYLIAYLEQALKAAIDGSHRNGNFVVTPESIISNLVVLQEYKPLLRHFFAKDLFGAMDERYFRLIDRAGDMTGEIDWPALDLAGVKERYRNIFNSTRNVRKEAYFDSMTHFDFKCLLPALLQVEDRMSMAHGLEARAPLLDRPLVELLATIPANIKFPDGRMKHLLKEFARPHLPEVVVDRRDKMGFPVPLKEWLSGPLHDFVHDIFSSQAAKSRPYFNNAAILNNFTRGGQFSRKIWGLLSLEIWHQLFHDRASNYRAMISSNEISAPAA